MRKSFVVHVSNDLEYQNWSYRGINLIAGNLATDGLLESITVITGMLAVL